MPLRAGFRGLTRATTAPALSAAVASPSTSSVNARPPHSEVAGLQPLAVFDDYVNGSPRTRGPWHVNTSGPLGVFAGDEVPATQSGKAMAPLLGGEHPDVPQRGNAYATLDALSIAADTSASTVFWKVLAGGGLAPQERVLRADRRPRGRTTDR